jgi:hypothetical protein
VFFCASTPKKSRQKLAFLPNSITKEIKKEIKINPKGIFLI